MEKMLLWRVIYTPRVTLQADSFSAGPWHPSKAYVEQCAAALGRQSPVGVQSNKQASSGASIWPVG